MVDSWIIDIIGPEEVKESLNETQKAVLYQTLESCGVDTKESLNISKIEDFVHVLELSIYQQIVEGISDPKNFADMCKNAFLSMSVLRKPEDSQTRMKHHLKIACFGILGNRNTDVQTYLQSVEWELSEIESDNWAHTVFNYCGEAFLRVVRKSNWSDLDQSRERIATLRTFQSEYESAFLKSEDGLGQSAALELASLYHLAKAIDLLVQFTSSGEPKEISDPLNHHFDHAIKIADSGGFFELSVLLSWIKSTSHRLIDVSIWKNIEMLDETVSDLARSIASRGRPNPILELWPSQQIALAREKLLDPAMKAIVIQMPTSSGKTLLAEFKIAQTKQNYPSSWIAYIAPTRTLVNQISISLRRTLTPLGIQVTKAIPVYEMDTLEHEKLQKTPFDVLVTTPEKLDLIIRGEKLDFDEHPLGLIIFDEAQTLGRQKTGNERPLKAEMVLSIVQNRFPDTKYLLLTPFVHNASELAKWLGSTNSSTISLDWKPNEQMVALVSAVGSARNWHLEMNVQYSSIAETIISDNIAISGTAPINKAISTLRKRDIAVLCAKILMKRGNLVVYTQKSTDTIKIAEELCKYLSISNKDEDLQIIRKYLQMEYGTSYKLAEFLEYGVAYHHGGVSEDCRILIEWLVNQGSIKALVGTTTIAYGVNLPISSLVMNSYTIGQPASPMNSNLFWNIVGRVGRAHQDALGIVLLVDIDDTSRLEEFVKKKFTNLVSSLERSLLTAAKMTTGTSLEYILLIHPELTNFLQYLAHIYRYMGDHELYIEKLEEILELTLGFQSIAKKDTEAANSILELCKSYAEEMKEFEPEILPMVDQTGFSPDTVKRVSTRPMILQLSEYTTPADLFSNERDFLPKLAGSLISIKELDFKKPFEITQEAIAKIIRLWVQGSTISEIAQLGLWDSSDSESILTKHTQAIIKISTLGSWGMGAIVNRIKADDEYKNLDERTSTEIQAFSSMVFFGVDTLEAIAMRSLGIPRLIAKRLGMIYRESTENEIPQIHEVEEWLIEQNNAVWDAAIPPESLLSGAEFKRIWEILTGIE